MGGGAWSAFVDPRFLHFGTSWREVVSFMLLPLNPREMSSPIPGSDLIGIWVGSTDRLGDMEEREYLTYWDSNFDTSVFSL
jgi:hypothetical protein